MFPGPKPGLGQCDRRGDSETGADNKTEIPRKTENQKVS